MNFSFIIPLYNDEKNIRFCLDAVCSECINGDEIIVVDNGSTDNSDKIVFEYHFVNVYSLPRKTIGELRNYGSLHANGNILAFIDSDCIISEGWRKKVETILHDESIAATGSKYKIPLKPNWIEQVWFSQRNTVLKTVKYINAGNFAIKSNIFKEIGGFNSNLVTGEDAELGLRLCFKGFKLVENPEIECVHLGNPQSLSAFYTKQKWHAAGMFGTFKQSFWDKPLIMTIVFIINIFASILLIPVALKDTTILFIQIILIFFVPFFSSLFRWRQYRFKGLYFPLLVILYLIYFFARSHMLLNIIMDKIVRPHFR